MAIAMALTLLEALAVLVKYFLDRKENTFEMPLLMDPQHGGIFEHEYAALLGKSLEETREIMKQLVEKGLVVMRTRECSVMVPTVWPSGKGITEGMKDLPEPEPEPEMRESPPMQQKKVASKR